MTQLLAFHAVLALLAVPVARRIGPRVFLVAALGPLSCLGWLLTRVDRVLHGTAEEQHWAWAPALGLDVHLHMDGLSLLLSLLVSSVGALVLLYAWRYFEHRTEGLGRTAAVLVLFAGAMLGVVWADNVLLLYVAWELTTVCSFLLIGDDGSERPNRVAALRALLVTTGAGFAMLLGLLLIGEAAGTYRLSALVADPPTGPATAAGVVLVLVGALAKCAQVPFHPWLPAAMAAPTPVSAYLHAAAMVKAGVYLVARLAPGFADVPTWLPVVLTVGALTMLLGGWRALAETDLKRLLAFGTIAQLGFLVVLVGAGTRVAALAGATMLLAHALFKGTLFLVVGVIDHASGTRDTRELSGLARRSPALLGISILACLSMVGLPASVGYLGKEAAFEAFLEPGPGHRWVLAGIALGSVLTVAYTLRFLVGAFGSGAGTPTDWHAPRADFLVAPAVLAVAGVVLGALPERVDSLAAGHADAFPVPDASYHLALWHGLGLPVYLSLVTLAAGAAVFVASSRSARGHDLLPPAFTAAALQDRLARTVLRVGDVTARAQNRSLPSYLARTVVVIAVTIGVFLVRVDPADGVRPWDTPAQPLLAVAITACCAVMVVTRHRLTAVIALSAAGYLVATLFVLYGAPDLALAQLLVETLTFVVFVLVLRRMPRHVDAPSRHRRPVRITAAVLLGAVMTLATLAVTAGHQDSRVADEYLRAAPDEGGPNVVNVILTEFRALDTLGEVTVLATASTAVAGLVLASSRLGGAPRPSAAPRGAGSARGARDG